MAPQVRKKWQIKAIKKEPSSSTTTMAPPAPTGVERKPTGPLNWLFCSVCDGTPKYSDVSHLLTHISSKGHLHAFSQAEIRALNNPEAEKTIREYKKWEADHGIKVMLASRLAAKESKDAVKRRRTPAIVKTRGNAAMKVEADDEEIFMYGAAGASQNGPYYTVNPYGHGPRRLLGPESSFGGSTSASLYSSFYDSRESSVFATQTTESGDGNVALDTDVGPLVRLKGITWPGMAIFDAASEDMKRKRNQRKDNSVTERLLASSESINTDELVFNTEFEMQRRRDVYDSPSPPPEATEAATRSDGTKGRKRRSAGAQTGRVTKKRAAAVKTGRATRSRGHVARSSTPKSEVTTPNAVIIIDNDDDDDDEIGRAIDAMGAEEAMEESSYMSADHYADTSLIDPKDESHVEDGMYGGGMAGSVHGHLDFEGDVATMGQKSGIEDESKRLDPSYYSPSSDSLSFLASPQSCKTEQTIDPALLTPPSTNAETRVDRQDASRMSLVDMQSNHAMPTSPTPARMTPNRTVSSYQNLLQSPPSAYYCSAGPFHGGNTNPLCPRPSHTANGYSVYNSYTQANPMYMHSHGHHAPPSHGFSGMMQYGSGNDAHYAHSASNAANAPSYRVN